MFVGWKETKPKNLMKKIIFPIISLFLAYQSYKIIHTLWFIEPYKLNTWVQIIISLLLNLFVTGVFAFIGFAFSSHKVLSPNYYKVNNTDLLNKTYKYLQVEYFKRFLLIVFWGNRKNRKKYFDGTKLGLENFDFQTKQSEFGHLAAFIALQIVAAVAFLKGHFEIAVLTLLLNFISNFYPIILQRKHRIQIERIRNIMIKKGHYHPD